jgi:uncharacterized glyoxalase superfamily protein PhnB
MPQTAKPIPQRIPRGYAAIGLSQRRAGARILQVGQIRHAQLKIGDSIVMVTDEFPDWKCLSPLSLGGSAVTLHIYTPDADAVFSQAAAAGAR